MSGYKKPPVGAQLKLDHPLARGLVGCWLLNERSGDKAYDSSGQGNIGTLTGMDPATDWVGSLHGGALDFDGSNDYIECADSPSLNIIKSITISAWINFAVTNSPIVIVGRGNYQYLLYWNAGQSVLSLWTGGSETQQFFTPVVGTWYHIVAINDEYNNKRTIYINGKELSGSSSYVPSSSANVVLRIGDSENFSYHWNGKIENILIYNRALSAQEVATLHAFPYAMFEEESPYWILKAAGGATYNESITVSSSPALSNSPKVDFFPSLGAFASTPALNRAVSADLLGGVTMLSTPAASMIGGMDYAAAVTFLSNPAVSMAYLLDIFPSLILSSDPALATFAIADFYNSLTLASTPAAVMAAVADLFVSLVLASSPAWSAVGGSDFYESLGFSSSPALSNAVFKEAFGELSLLSSPAVSASVVADLLAAIAAASSPAFLAACGFDFIEAIILASGGALGLNSSLTTGLIASIGSKRASAGLKRAAGAGLRRDA